MILLKRIFFLLLVTMTVAFSACSRVDSQSVTGISKTPDFKLRSVGGEEIRLSDQLKEKKAVIVFFATWCPGCVNEVPQVKDYNSRKKDKVFVAGINVQESEAKVKGFMKKKGIDYTVLLDRDGRVARQYKVTGIPTVIALDNDGTVLYRGHDITEMEEKTGI